MADAIQLVERLQGAATVGRAFGEPIRQGDTLIIPVAAVHGGGGGGGGRGNRGQSDHGEGGGAGYGLQVSPRGVFAIRGQQVRWQPAVDVNRIVLGAQIVLALALLTLRSLLRRRGRAGRLLR